MGPAGILWKGQPSPPDSSWLEHQSEEPELGWSQGFKVENREEEEVETMPIHARAARPQRGGAG
jgi:hypothetical protein